MCDPSNGTFSSPAAHLKGKTPETPIRLTPTYEQFKGIIANVRAQQFNADAQGSRRLAVVVSCTRKAVDIFLPHPAIQNITELSSTSRDARMPTMIFGQTR